MPNDSPRHHQIEVDSGFFVLVVHSDKKHVRYSDIIVRLIGEAVASCDFGVPIGVKTLGTTVQSLDNYYEKILAMTDSCIMGIVVLDGLRPNVTLELGMLLGCKKPVLLVSTKGAEIAVRSFFPSDQPWKAAGLTEKGWNSLLNAKLDVSSALSDLAGLHVVRCANPVDEMEEFRGKIAAEVQALRSRMLQSPIFKDHKGKLRLLATEQVANEKLAEAIATYDQILALDIKDVAARRSKMAILARLERFHESWAIGEELLSENPNDVSVLFLILECCWALEKHVDADTFAAKLHQLDPDGSVGNLGLGTVRFHQKRYAEAIPLLEKAASLDPEDCNAERYRARSLANLERLDDARAAWRRVQAIHPEESQPIVAEARLFRRERRFKEALDVYARARKIDPTDIVACMGQFDMYRALGEPARAIPLAEEALRIDPRDASVMHVMGHALAEVGRDQEAIAWHKKSLEIQNSIEVHNCLALLCLQQNDLVEGLYHSKAATEVPEPAKHALSTHSVALALIGETDAARAASDTGLAELADDPDYLVERAIVFSKIDLAAARTCIENAKKLDGWTDAKADYQTVIDKHCPEILNGLE